MQNRGKGEVVSLAVGKFIERRRNELQLTQLELAKRLGYKYRNFIGMLENGKAEFPLNAWSKFADALEVNRGEFLMLVLKQLHPNMLDFVEIKPARKARN